jgi:hypothetical protein
MTFDEWFEKNSKDQMRSAFNAGFEEGVRSEKAKTKPSVPAPITTPPKMHRDMHRDPFSCSKCGLLLDGVMGYVCNDMKCPTFKHTWSGTITSGGPAVMGSGGSAGAIGSTGSYIVSDIKR